MKEQRRSRRVAMTAAEVDAFLSDERTCRVATTGADGRPHVTPLWFAWDGRALWLTSLVRSQRWTDLARDPRVAVVIDTGERYEELRGVEISGTARPVGDVPRGAEDHPELAEPERLFARKYGGVDDYVPDGKHAWLRVDPDKMVSWDFRKLR